MQRKSFTLIKNKGDSAKQQVKASAIGRQKTNGTWQEKAAVHTLVSSPHDG